MRRTSDNSWQSGLAAIAVVGGLLLGGCASNVNVREAMQSNPTAAPAVAEAQLPAQPAQLDDHLLELMNAGDAHRFVGDYDQSFLRFDQADQIINYWDRQGRVLEVFENIGALIANDNIVTYRGYEFEGILINTYKALNLLATGDFDGARTEFRRAYERQGQAVRRFEEEIEDALEDRSDLRGPRGQTAERLMRVGGSKLSADRIIRDRYRDIDRWSVYENFVNPFASYLQGLYYLLYPQDRIDWSSEGSQALRRAYAMVPENPAVAADLELIERLADGELTLAEVPPTTWVFVENGWGPTLSSQSLPIPLAIDGVSIILPLAFPVYHNGWSVYPFMRVEGPGIGEKTELLASIDAVVRAEFRKRLPAIITRAIVSAALKGAAQYLAFSEGGEWALLIAQAASVASAQADTRMWTTLPDEIGVARVATPDNGQLRLLGPQGQSLGTLQLSPERFHWVFVRIVEAGQAPRSTVITFPEPPLAPAHL